MDLTPEYTTIIVASVTGLLTAITTYFGVRFKKGKSAVKELLEANAEFRNEVRTDLKQTKAELSQAWERIRELERSDREKDVLIAELKKSDKEKDILIAELTIENKSLRTLMS